MISNYEVGVPFDKSLFEDSRQLVLHVDVQLQQSHRPLTHSARWIHDRTDGVVLHVVSDAVDQRNVAVFATGGDQLVHDTARHLHEDVLGMIGAHCAILGIQVNAQTLLDEQGTGNLQ